MLNSIQSNRSGSSSSSSVPFVRHSLRTTYRLKPHPNRKRVCIARSGAIAGMIDQIGPQFDLMSGVTRCSQLEEALRAHYAGSEWVRVVPPTPTAAWSQWPSTAPTTWN